MMVDGELYNGRIELLPPEPLMNLSITKSGTTTHHESLDVRGSHHSLWGSAPPMKDSYQTKTLNVILIKTLKVTSIY